MSDYGENVADFESDLGTFAAEQEASGFDAVETTEAGRLLDSQLQNTAENGGAQYVIDTVAEARQAETHTKKENEKAADAREAIREVFARAHQHINDHKYELSLDGKSYEVSHGDLKKFFAGQKAELKEKLKKASTEADRHQLMRDLNRIADIHERMEKGEQLTQEDIDFLQDDYFVRHRDAAAEFKSMNKATEQALDQDHVDLIRQQREAFPENEDHTIGNDFNAQSQPVELATDDMLNSDFENDFGEIIIAQSNTQHTETIKSTMVNNNTISNDFAI